MKKCINNIFFSFSREQQMDSSLLIKGDDGLKKNIKIRPRRDSNPQSSDPKSDALSIRPRGRYIEVFVNLTLNINILKTTC